MKNSPFKSLIELNLATVFLSTSGVLGKLITLTPIYTIFMRGVVALILLFIFDRLRGVKPKINFKRDGKFFLITGSLLGVHWATYFIAIDVSTVAVAVISLFTFPIITTILEPLFSKTKLSVYNIIGAIVVMIGIGFVMPDFDLGNDTTLGVVIGIFSAVCFSIRNIMNKRFVGVYSSSTIMIYQMMVSSFILIIPTFYFSDPYISASNLFYLFFLGLITTAIGQTMFVQSLKKFSAATASVIASMQPIYGIIIAYFLLGEEPEIQVIFGGMLILLTVLGENLRQMFSMKTKANPKTL